MNGATTDALNSSGSLTYQSYVLGPPVKYTSCVIGRSVDLKIALQQFFLMTTTLSANANL